MWYKTRLIKYLVVSILILLIILILSQLDFLINPILQFFTTLLSPVLIAVIFYYLLRPFVIIVEKGYTPRWMAILIVYTGFIIFFSVLGIFLWPILVDQVNEFIKYSPVALEKMRERSMNLIQLMNIDALQIQQAAISFVQNTYSLATKNIISILTFLTKAVISIVIIPFILFFFLRDDHKIVSYFLNIIPVQYEDDVKILLRELDSTLDTFISSQMLVVGIVGVLLFIGYEIIGLKYALVLAMFAMVFYIIPMLGTIIASIPALLVAFAEGPFMAFKVTIVLAIAHAVEANLITPNVMAQRLQISPLTVILLLLTCGSLYGIIGLFLATPVYALLKVTVLNLKKIFQRTYG